MKKATQLLGWPGFLDRRSAIFHVFTNHLSELCGVFVTMNSCAVLNDCFKKFVC